MRAAARTGVRTGPPPALIAFAFVALVCGSNALTPLLPLYAERLALTPVDRAVVFCGYFLGLITVLVLAARTRLVQAARAALLAALAISVLGDTALILGSHTPQLLAVGRVFIGISVALGTGSAAALMVAARGEAGRAFIAAGSLVGACVGLAAALAIVTWLPGPMLTVYLVHAVVAVGTLIALAVSTRRRPGPPLPGAGRPERAVVQNDGIESGGTETGGTVSGPPVASPPPVLSRRIRVGAFAAGGVAWAMGALATGSLPATLVLTGLVDTTLVAVAVGGLSLLTSCAGIALGLGAPLARVWPLVVAGSWALVVVGVWTHWLPVIVLGCALGGVGQAGAYRSGLRRLTVGLDPLRQGQVTSAYAAVAYGSCAASLLGAGWLEQWLGVEVGGGVLAGALLAVAAVTTVLLSGRTAAAEVADIPRPSGVTAGQAACAGAGDPLN